tara:strand:- start:1545 stop:2930 length:1386 start_codon:yes stop_codon:yes gene_type:complete
MVAERPTIAIYVPQRYTKGDYKRDSFHTRLHRGIHIVKDALERAGREVEYCSMATAHRYAIVLVSMTDGIDWFPFIEERRQWVESSTVVVVGGAGLLNVRPFLQWFDIGVFGRAEGIIAPLVDAIYKGEEFDHPSVCYSETFDPSDDFEVSQSSVPYPHSVQLMPSPANRRDTGKEGWVEAPLGCKRKCWFCAYTWHRKPLAGVDDPSYATGEDTEATMLDLDPATAASWPHIRHVGLDGLSQRLRFAMNKRITRAMFWAWFGGLAASGKKPHQVKLYNVVGIPSEDTDEWFEHLDDLARIDSALPDADPAWSIVLQSTPFMPMPATPAAVWPMSKRNYRGLVSRTLQKPGMPGNTYFQGRALWAVESSGTESLATAMVRALTLRGVEEDADLVERIAVSRRFWTGRMQARAANMERHGDMDRLFRAYTWDDLPTRYLKTYGALDRMRVQVPTRDSLVGAG